jgi:ribosome-associated translation inhibitor RaiA
MKCRFRSLPWKKPDKTALSIPFGLVRALRLTHHVKQRPFSIVDMRNSPSMRIDVLGDDTISPQARTYAEYRVFAALTQLADAGQVHGARVVLRRANRGSASDDVTCIVTVTLAGSRPLRVRTTGDHPYAAINRAVERLRSASTSEFIDPGSVESGGRGRSCH